MPVIRSLSVKSLLSVLVPMALALTIVAIIAANAFEGVARDVVVQRDTDLASVSAKRLSEGLVLYSSLLQEIAAGDEGRSMDPVRLILALEEAQNLLYIFDAGLAVYDSEGLVLAPRGGTDFPIPSKLDEMISTLRPVYSDIFEDAITGEDVILIGVPILGRDGEFEGTLTGKCTLRYSLLGSKFASILELKAGRSGYAYLVDGSGRVIYHRNSSMLGGSLAGTDPVRSVTRGETGAVFTEDATGEAVISGFASVPGTGWGLVTQERWDVVMAPIRRYSILLLALLVVGSVTSGVLVFFSNRLVLKPIQNLTRGAERIASGDFDHTVVAETGDELEILARQFNAMTTSLKESFAELEQELSWRKQAEGRLEIVNRLLHAIRNVNQLFTKERDIDRLLESACERLVETDIYTSAWILLLNEDGTPTKFSGRDIAGHTMSLADIPEPGELPACAQDVMTQAGAQIIPNGADVCQDCLLLARRKGINDVMAIRLEYDGKLYGVLNIAITSEAAIDVEGLVLFDELAEDISYALHGIEIEEERTQAEERALRLLEQQVAVNQLALALGETRDLRMLYHTIFKHIETMMDAWGFIVSSFDNETQLIQAEYIYYKGTALDVAEFPPIPLTEPGQGGQSQVIRTGEPMYDPDHRKSREDGRPLYTVEENGTISEGPPPEEDEDSPKSALYVPMKIEGKVIGVIQLQSRQLDAYSAGDIDLLTGMANVAAVASQNTRLYNAGQQELNERKRVEEALRESENKYRKLFELGSDPLFLIEVDTGRILDINETALKLYGYSREEALQMKNSDFSEEPARAQQAIKEHEQHIPVRHHKRKDGTFFPADISVSYFNWNEREVCIAAIRDITEHLQSEEALKQYSEKLEEMVEERTHDLHMAQEELVRKEKLATLGQLGGGVAHELRNPLGVISNAVYFLRASLSDADETTVEYLDMMSSEISRAIQIIENLLRLTRKDEPRMEEIPVAALIADGFGRQVPPEGVQASTIIADETLTALVDPSQIGQVMENLLSNAYQAMPEGGELTVRAWEEDSDVYISVTDTGCGIPEENLHEIFEPLFTTKARGIGLGLALSKDLVEANNGSIEVESEVGHGSRFTVILPAPDSDA